MADGEHPCYSRCSASSVQRLRGSRRMNRPAGEDDEGVSERRMARQTAQPAACQPSSPLPARSFASTSEDQETHRRLTKDASPP